MKAGVKMTVNEYIDYLVEWLKEQVEKTHSKGLILGVSGGIDSAVVAYLVKRACPNNSLGVIMPCHSDRIDEMHALEIINDSGLAYTTLILDDAFDTLIEAIEDLNISFNDNGWKMARGNTKARLRMTSLYALAQNYGYLVVGTDNADEWATGYFTKFGDGGVDIVPLINLVKCQVREMAHILGVPSSIINKEPAAGLYGTQTDEQELGLSYEQIDKYLLGQGVEQSTIERMEVLMSRSAHKRTIAPAPEILFNKNIRR